MDTLDKLTLWYQVSTAKFLGPLTFKKLWEELRGDIAHIFSMTDEELLGHNGVVTSQNLKGIREQAGKAGDARAFMSQQLELCQRAGGRIVTLDEHDYPIVIRESQMCHPILYCIGDLANFVRYDKAMAIVGTREPAHESADLARRAARELAENDWVIVSGLAKGIDSCAHSGALDAGGRTIAVLGCGPDVLYPPDSAAIYEQIKINGLVLSEFPFGVRPDDWKLKRRNRTIVAMSSAVFIMETGATDGTMNAVRACAEQAKLMFTVLPPWHCDNTGNRVSLHQGAILLDHRASFAGQLRPFFPSQERGEVIRFMLGGSLSVDDARSIAADISAETAGQAVVTYTQRVPLPEAAATGVEIVGIAGAVAAILRCVVTIWHAYRDHKSKSAWSASKFKEAVATTLLGRGVTDFGVRRVSGFQSLRGRGKGPCAVVVDDTSTGCSYKIYIFFKGDAYVVRLETP